MFWRASIISIILTGIIVWFIPRVKPVEDISNGGGLISFSSGDSLVKLKELTDLSDYSMVFLPSSFTYAIPESVYPSMGIENSIARKFDLAKPLEDKKIALRNSTNSTDVFDLYIMSTSKPLRSYMRSDFVGERGEAGIVMTVIDMDGKRHSSIHKVKIQGVNMDELWMPVDILTIIGDNGVIYLPLIETSSGSEELDNLIFEYAKNSDILKKLNRGYYKVNFSL